jgi:Uma2 family endonuclease
VSGLPPRRPGTVTDWLAADEDERLELIDGELIPKASPDPDHGSAQAGTMVAVHAPFHRSAGGPGGPGGWWITSEVDILLGGQGYRPDLVGWRRDRVPERPRGKPVRITPDWICEIASESNRDTETIKKLVGYHLAGVPHYWILDQLDRTLTVHRHTEVGYVIVLRAAAHERVRAEPFDAIELQVATLLGDDPDEP